MDENIKDRIQDALKGHDARYVEVRVEEVEGSHIQYRGKELDEIGHTKAVGGCIRALGGGWGFASFNELEGLKEKVATAVGNARLIGDRGNRPRSSRAGSEYGIPPRGKGPSGCPAT